MELLSLMEDIVCELLVATYMYILGHDLCYATQH